MITWKRTPSIALLNRVAENAYNDAIIAHAKYQIARDGYHALTETDVSDDAKRDAQEISGAAKKELSDKEAAADTAAQAAIDAILSTLDDNERYIYSQRVQRMDRVYRRPRYEWQTLQDNDGYAIFTEDEWYEMEDAQIGRASADEMFDRQFTADDGRIVMKWHGVDTESVAHASERMENAPADILRTRREMAGMSITELAKKTGITRTALSRLENGHTSLYRADAGTVRNLADALGVSVSTLLPVR